MGERRGSECFACRVMRSFALTGLGAGIGGLAALAFGLDQGQTVSWIVVAGLITGIGATRRRAGQ